MGRGKNDLATRITAKAQVDYSKRPRRSRRRKPRCGIAELNRRMVESANLKDNLEDSLNVVVNQLDSWVK
jgi:hypothetical protein